jgi:hypothetical protein
VSVTVQRRYPDSSFGFYTKTYMEKLGLFEILIKTLTFLLFLGTTVVLVKHFRKVKDVQESRNEKPPLIDKYEFH